MSSDKQTLFQAVQEWFAQESTIKSVALFGSSAIGPQSTSTRDQWSDIDLHIVTTEPERLEHVDWTRILPHQDYCGQSVRSASGGVSKVTVVFTTGQLDLVVVPRSSMNLAKWGLALGLERRHKRLRTALNGMRTCIRCGYRMLKGESIWGGFYKKVLTKMEGVRLADEDMVKLADIALVDQLWILQKLQRGEIVAAQHQLHTSLVNKNLQLLRELRVRSDQPVLSYGLGRHVERLLTPEELSWVKIDAACDADGLRNAVWQANAGLKALMCKLVPTWHVPPKMADLLERFSSEP